MANRYFDPATQARVGKLELVARQVVEGFLSGRHRSPYHGFSAEYLDHRAYTPGDEIAAIDWKVLARTDKYYVKLFEDETNLRATLLLDCSKSMAFQSGEFSKLEFGCYLAAALTSLLLRQNDSVGLVTFDTGIRQYLPPQAHPSQFRRVLEALDGTASEGDTDVGKTLHEVAERIRRRGLVIILSDLLDDPQHIAAGLQHFRHNRHEVLVFHILDDAELTFPYQRLTRFQDMEGTGRVVVNPQSLRQQYLDRMQRYIETIQASCFERKISYHLARTSQAPAAVLAEFLDRRSRLG